MLKNQSKCSIVLHKINSWVFNWVVPKIKSQNFFWLTLLTNIDYILNITPIEKYEHIFCFPLKSFVIPIVGNYKIYNLVEFKSFSSIYHKTLQKRNFNNSDVLKLVQRCSKIGLFWKSNNVTFRKCNLASEHVA